VLSVTARGQGFDDFRSKDLKSDALLMQTRSGIAHTLSLSSPSALARNSHAQIWIIGSREQVNHLINECYVRKLASDRVQFTPIVPAPFAAGKFMSVLVR
jgi:hypothetical protein